MSPAEKARLVETLTQIGGFTLILLSILGSYWWRRQSPETLRAWWHRKFGGAKR